MLDCKIQKGSSVVRLLLVGTSWTPHCWATSGLVCRTVWNCLKF